MSRCRKPSALAQQILQTTDLIASELEFDPYGVGGLLHARVRRDGTFSLPMPESEEIGEVIVVIIKGKNGIPALLSYGRNKRNFLSLR